MNEGKRFVRAEEASIRTASVEIRTLTVNGKQMTMGVFRQLVIENVLSPEARALKGRPWGLVNYFPKPCEPDHLHIVWQKGGDLRRACVYPEPWVPISADAIVDHEMCGELVYAYGQAYARRTLGGDERERFEAESERLARFKDRYRDAYADLAVLPQLFIAV